MGFLLDRTLFCLTTFLATISTLQNAGGIQSVAAQQYLLGLGKLSTCIDDVVG